MKKIPKGSMILVADKKTSTLYFALNPSGLAYNFGDRFVDAFFVCYTPCGRCVKFDRYPLSDKYREATDEEKELTDMLYPNFKVTIEGWEEA